MDSILPAVTDTHSISSAQAGTYTPFAVNGDRDPFGSLHLLEFDGGDAPRVIFGIWRCPPLTVEVTPTRDEGIYVVAGTVELAIDDGAPARLGAGDLVLVRNGARCRYTVSEDLTAVFASA